MTKEEFITLLREDMLYQLHELAPDKKTFIKINGFTLFNLATIKLHLCERYVAVSYRRNGGYCPVAAVYYEDIRTIGYKYRDATSLGLRLDEIKRMQ